MLDLPDNIFVNNHPRFIYEYLQYDSLKNYIIPYVDHMEKIEELKYTSKTGSLEISLNDVGNLKNIKIPINEFIFKDRQTIDQYDSKPIKLNPILLDSLQSLCFINIPLFWVSLGISTFSRTYKNISKFSVSFT
mmetsp:Transcript_27756/g.24549  ORF Transcript_27756/g.24549 Transcript_27756/m.24549 type:complete len:134 (-) Transcript_27756:832-1233(-)